MSEDLFKKYDTPGPRYTSYPTVPYWSQNPTVEEWIGALKAKLEISQEDGIGAALYIHIPFCESLCTYCGCNTRITRNHKVAHPYIQTVLREWGLYLEKLGSSMLLSEIHLGGGTPTFLSPEELDTLISGILDRPGISIAPDFEFSVEADPRVTKREHLVLLSKLPGRKRLSLGIQDFDAAVQNIVHRVQSEEQVREITNQARELGFESINYDLIYGLPLQTRESVRSTVEAVARLRADRIAFYGYAHVPWIKPGQRRFTEQDLPSGDEKRALYELGRTILEGIGYREVGMDHFALETDSLWRAHLSGTLHRNFMGYTSRFVAPLIGLGVSAIGDAWEVYAQNEKLLETYEKKVAAGELPIFRGHVLSEEDCILRQHILNLMTRFETSWRQQDSEFLSQVAPKLKGFCEDELVEMTAKGGINLARITNKGRPFIRNISMTFDARLAVPKSEGSQPLFSRTI